MGNFNILAFATQSLNLGIDISLGNPFFLEGPIGIYTNEKSRDSHAKDCLNRPEVSAWRGQEPDGG